MRNFNLLIVGDKTVGKTTFIQRHRSGQFQGQTVPTESLTLDSLSFQTSSGQITFNIYEGGCPESVDAAIIMFDLQNPSSFESIMNHQRWLTSNFGTLPMVVVGNKMDLGRKIKSGQISKFLESIQYTLLYFEVSAKSNYNYEKPFLFLARKLVDPTAQTYEELRKSSLKFI